MNETAIDPIAIDPLEAMRWIYEEYRDHSSFWEKIDSFCYRKVLQSTSGGGILQDVPLLLKSMALGYWLKSPY